MKFHGSYQQDDRERRTKGQGKFYQFMMRTRQPAGHVTNQLYKVMDDLADLVSDSPENIVTLVSQQSRAKWRQRQQPACSSAVMQRSSTVVCVCSWCVSGVDCLSACVLMLQYGNGTLRLTTRQAYQLHGVLKGDLKSVFSTVIKNMGSTLVSARHCVNSVQIFKYHLAQDEPSCVLNIAS